MIDKDTAIRQHALQISEADWELQIPTNGPKDNLSRKLAALERIPTRGHQSVPPRQDPNLTSPSVTKQICNKAR